MRRRQFLKIVGAGMLTPACTSISLEGGLWNSCLSKPIPPNLKAIIQDAWQGLDPGKVWDSHLHIVGTGDSDSGVWINPATNSLMHPVQYTQRKFYLNATCTEDKANIDKGFVTQLLQLMEDFPKGAKSVLLAFDYKHDESGEVIKNQSAFYVPDSYAAQLASTSDRFEWMASIHPYRKDSLGALADAASKGAVGVKWLPPAMGIDPASPLCDPFYDALLKYDIPLLCHAGDENAVQSGNHQKLGNPLLLRRALDRGVKVIVAHCASLGASIDLDKGTKSNEVANFELFSRLMDDKHYENNLFADISAMTQVNRIGRPLEQIIERQDWHHRLINGSDYPLPGVVPIISLNLLLDYGYITEQAASFLAAIRHYNPILFDFVLKRQLRYKGKKLSNVIFESARILSRDPLT